VVAPEVFAEHFTLTAVYSWEDFLASEAQEPVEILFIHGSMADQVDTEWTREAYRRGVMIAGITLPFAQLRDIVGDFCVDPPPDLLKYVPHAAYLVEYTLRLEPEYESYRDAITTGDLETCKAFVPDQTIQASTTHSANGLPLGPNHHNFGELAISLLYRSVYIDLAKPDNVDEPLPLPSPNATETSS
jgi:hypothetical protein